MTTLKKELDNPGYHIRKIKRGELGEPSKIREELEELEDALEQENKIMAMCELSDLYGALKAVAARMSLSMKDLEVMSNATERAFKSGRRASNDKKSLQAHTEDCICKKCRGCVSSCNCDYCMYYDKANAD